MPFRRACRFLVGCGLLLLLKGDIVTNAHVVGTATTLAARKPGDRIEARLSRNGAESTVQVTLGSITS